MYSEKDTCCFCVPLQVGVIIIFVSTIMELMGALAEKNIGTILAALGLVILFIVSFFFKQSVCMRRALAGGYVVTFILEVFFTTIVILMFFSTNYPFQYCEAM